MIVVNPFQLKILYSILDWHGNMEIWTKSALLQHIACLFYNSSNFPVLSGYSTLSPPHTWNQPFPMWLKFNKSTFSVAWKLFTRKYKPELQDSSTQSYCCWDYQQTAKGLHSWK